MKSLYRICQIVGVGFLTLLCQPRTLPAQEAISGTQPPPKRLVLTPMKPPQPALKYELLPRPIDRIPGNAAVHYGKVKSEQNHFFSSKEMAKTIELAQQSPLNELKTKSEFDTLTNLGSIYASLKLGSRCEHADWQLPIREVYFGKLLLPEAQESRSFARLLQGRARVQMARGDLEGAIDSIRTGIALGRHVAEGETVINALIGGAISSVMFETVQELISQPEAPNLYWALAALPTPLIDLQPGLEAEQYALYWTENKWLHPELMQGDESFWRDELNRLWSYVDAGNNIFNSKTKTTLTALVIRSYPVAKKRLVDRGFKLGDVEEMPVAKVIFIDALHQYNCNRDAQIVAVQQALVDPTRVSYLAKVESQKLDECIPISSALGIESYSIVINAMLRTQRNVATLQVIEAIRLHAAETGKLPARLGDISAVIVPNDPSNNQPFSYELNKDVALLSSTTLNAPVRLELKLN